MKNLIITLCACLIAGQSSFAANGSGAPTGPSTNPPPSGGTTPPSGGTPPPADQLNVGGVIPSAGMTNVGVDTKIYVQLGTLKAKASTSMLTVNGASVTSVSLAGTQNSLTFTTSPLAKNTTYTATFNDPTDNVRNYQWTFTTGSGNGQAITAMGTDAMGTVLVAAGAQLFATQYNGLFPIGSVSSGTISLIGNDGAGHTYVAAGSSLYSVPELCAEIPSDGSSSGGISTSGGFSSGGTAPTCINLAWGTSSQLQLIGQTVDGATITAFVADSSGNLYSAAGVSVYMTRSADYSSCSSAQFTQVASVPGIQPITFLANNGLMSNNLVATIYASAGASVYALQTLPLIMTQPSIIACPESGGAVSGSTGTSSGAIIGPVTPTVMKSIGMASSNITVLGGDGMGDILAGAGSTLYLAMGTPDGSLPLLQAEWNSQDGTSFTNITSDNQGYVYATAGATLYKVQIGCVYNIGNIGAGATYPACTSGASTIGNLTPIGNASGTIGTMFYSAAASAAQVAVTMDGSQALVPAAGGTNLDEVFVSSGTSVYLLRYKNQYFPSASASGSFGLFGKTQGTAPISFMQGWYVSAGSMVYSVLYGVGPMQVVPFGELPTATNP